MLETHFLKAFKLLKEGIIMDTTGAITYYVLKNDSNFCCSFSQHNSYLALR